MHFELQNVSIHFDAIPALSALSVQIPTGSMLMVTGPTGSGKTTLLRLLYADIFPSEGAVFISGQRTTTLGRRRHPAASPPNGDLLPRRAAAR